MSKILEFIHQHLPIIILFILLLTDFYLIYLLIISYKRYVKLINVNIRVEGLKSNEDLFLNLKIFFEHHDRHFGCTPVDSHLNVSVGTEGLKRLMNISIGDLNVRIGMNEKDT